MIGEITKNTFGTQMQIIREKNGMGIDVQFLDAYGYIKEHSTYANFKRGQIKNPYDKSVYGVGYIGNGKYATSIGRANIIEYSEWRSMIKRCYSETNKERYPAYYNICSVEEEWHNYQNFAEWYNENKYECEGRLHIDKDILIPGNKIYSKDTCILVPQRINMLFVNKPNNRGLPNGINLCGNRYDAVYCGKYLGAFNTIEEAYEVYSKEKEDAIKIIANEYKSIIPEKLYKALCKYKFDIRLDKNYKN